MRGTWSEAGGAWSAPHLAEDEVGNKSFRDSLSSNPPIVSEHSASVQFITARGLDFMVYPNPSSGRLSIRLPETGPYGFSIFNHLGQSVKTGTVESGSEIDLTGQKDGMYFIRVEKEHVYSETKAVLLFAD